ncbi:Riboflavin synthase [Penicillium riverlandense]|uniref:Riboflavin synthase n=1 Tax=Penicillium riverlandense TaxID=1903569 RepID=UPI0025493872|nr:Riboflavin synthase [Penicillium riverlandense]KAJ5818995.1 Riboflavin synthase [Penicillium riverlandense]
MLGYWLAFPTLLVVVERGYRFFLGFHHVPAEMTILDADTVSITTTLPRRGIWPYKAGQYVLVQVPQISLFQWHPFTISSCVDNEIKIHIKTDGNWTKSLRKLQNGQKLRCVGIDGPFGAPAQRFYEFDHTIIIGSGIGITPFAGILTDLQNKWNRHRGGDVPSLTESKPGQTVVGLGPTRHASHARMQSAKDGVDFDKKRTIELHWIVRDHNHLLWFSDLLNSLRCSTADEIIHNPKLNIRIHTHVTQKRRDICTHVFRYLLENHRTTEHPASPLTGLINPTHFGRPCLSTIMEEHYNLMQVSAKDTGRKVKIGVFFCGSPTLGYELSERCKLLTQRGYEDRSRIEYHFMMEVF